LLSKSNSSVYLMTGFSLFAYFMEKTRRYVRPFPLKVKGIVNLEARQIMSIGNVNLIFKVVIKKCKTVTGTPAIICDATLNTEAYLVYSILFGIRTFLDSSNNLPWFNAQFN